MKLQISGPCPRFVAQIVPVKFDFQLVEAIVGEIPDYKVGEEYDQFYGSLIRCEYNIKDSACQFHDCTYDGSNVFCGF